MNNKYYSCDWIEGGLFFGASRLNFCCITHSGNKGNPLICSFNGGELPLKKILDERNRLRALNQTGEESPCKGCYFLANREWEKKDALFDKVGIGNFSLCNLKCAYCYTETMDADSIDPFKHGNYDLVPIFEKLIEDGHLAKGAKILWGGGEPVLYREFEPLMKLILEHGVLNDIYTNATVYSDEIEQGLRTGQIRLLCCSVDAGSPEMYKQLKKKNLLNKVWINLKKYALAGGDKVLVKYIFQRENLSHREIALFIQNCAHNGIRRIRFDPEINELRKTDGMMTQATISAMVYAMRRANAVHIPYTYESLVSLRDKFRIKLAMAKAELARKKPDIEALQREFSPVFSKDFLREVSRLSIRMYPGPHLGRVRRNIASILHELAGLEDLGNIESFLQAVSRELDRS